MEFKYAGVTAIIGASLYIALSIKKYGANRILFYSGIYDFITYIKNQIEYFCTPTEDIIEGYSNNFLLECGFLSELQGSDWTRALKKCRYVDDNAKAILSGFSSKLGKSSKEEQIANCEYTIQAIEKQIDICRGDIIGKYKAYSSLTVIFGFMIVILLI